MPYSTGAAGTGTLTLTATGTNATDAGAFSIPVAVNLSWIAGGALNLDSHMLLQEMANAYDSTGRTTQVTDARGYVTDYQYGGNGNNAFLIQVKQWKTAPGGEYLATDVAYDNKGYVASTRDPGGSFRYFHYDTFGRLDTLKNTESKPVAAYAYAYSRTGANGWVFQPGSPNAITTTSFTEWTPPTWKAIVTVSYLDGLGRPVQTAVQDGANYHITAIEYDLFGRAWRTWKPYPRLGAGYDASFAFNATSYYDQYHGVATNPYVETRYRADALGRVSKVFPAYSPTTPIDSVLTSYGLDVSAKQQIIEITDEAGKKRRSSADVFGNIVTAILGYGAPEATTTGFTYNILGQRTQATDPRGLITTYTLDTRGLLASRTSPDAGAVSFKYDQAGNIRYTQHANQAAAGQVSFTTYDFANRPLVSGQGAETFSALNPFGSSAFEGTNTNWLVVRQYDAVPPVTFPWNLVPAPPPLANVAGRLAALASKSNGAWQVTYFSYNADGQVATRYTYTQANGGGSVLTALNTTATYTRDLRGALTQRSVTIGTNTFYHWYDYDSRGLPWRTFASTAGAKPGTPDVTNTYLPSGQAQNYQFQGGPLVPIRYTVRGQIQKVGDPTLTTYPFSARYAYLANGIVDTAEFYSAGSPVAQKRYRYAFGASRYDALNRLMGADFSSWSGSAWTTTLAYDLAGITYDAAGNLMALQRYRETATLIDNLAYTNATTSNRLNSIADAVAATAETWDAEAGSFTYDANGNLKTAPAPYSIAGVSYDPANLPLSITRSGATTTYRYDDGGQRIAKQVGSGNTEVYVRDGPATLGVFTVDGTGAPVSWYFNILSPGGTIGRQASTGTRTYYHVDMLGSTRAVVLNTTGAVVESYDFEPWGLLMPGRTLAGPTKEGFTSKEQDAETGLDYFGARYYMPAVGRWTSADPLADGTPAWSSYTYVLNNPLALVDPTGLEACGGSPLRGGGQSPRQCAGQGFDDRKDPIGAYMSPIYDKNGDYLGSDALGDLVGPPLVMDPKDFTQGMSHGQALRLGKSVYTLRRMAYLNWWGDYTQRVSEPPQQVGLRLPDFVAMDLNYQIKLPMVGKLFSISGTAAIDRYGNWYFGPGVGAGGSPTSVSGSLTVNWLEQWKKPSAEELDAYLTGHNLSVTAGYWFGGTRGGTPSETSGSSTAVGFGLVTPQAGLAYHYSFKGGNVGCGLECK
jgi:RHS repeat-associated protein